VPNRHLFFAMPPSVTDIIDLIEIIAPTHRAEPWDNCGLQVGNPEAPVSKIAVALEADERSILMAAEGGADLLITHHPLIFPSISSIDIRGGTGRSVAAALAAGISVYSAHTNLDHAPEGTSFSMAKKLSLVNPTPLTPPTPTHQAQSTASQCAAAGDGIVYIGQLTSKLNLIDLARSVKESLNAPMVRYVGDLQRPISRAAVCAGSGGDFIAAAHLSGADVLITGEVRYHAAVSAVESGIALIEAGHFWSELPGISEAAHSLEKQLRMKKWGVDVMIIQGQDPFSYV
jgi:dinuclear metal center YbgI/SA1388 family protein